MYYYVTSKEQLLFQCFVAGVERIRAAFRDVRRPGGCPARERLNAVLRRYGEAVASEFGWCMVRAEEQDLSPAMSRHIKALKSEIDQGIRRLIREGVQDGSIQPVRPEDDRVRPGRRAQLDRALVSGGSVAERRQIAEAFVTVFEAGLRPRANAAQLAPPREAPRRRPGARLAHQAR